jgi:hypothetical protein
MRRKRVWLLFIVASMACGGGVPAARLHANCATEPCPAGETCMAYYGIAGDRGPLFKTCEVQCSSNAVCPAPTQCGATADGPPGNTCR